MSSNERLEELKKKIRDQRRRESKGDDPLADLQLETHRSAAVAYRDPNNSCYWMTNFDGDWQKEDDSHLKRYLECRIFDGIDDSKTMQWMIKNYILEVHHKLSVHYAGPLAGYKRGVHRVCGNRVLVTREAEPIRPRMGKWPNLQKLIEEMLQDQTKYFYGWLKSGQRALKAGPPFRPGQALSMVGPGGCGKSLLQNLLTEVWGGRHCKPYKFMRGKTDFNSEHLGTEHLMIEDDAAATDLRSRREIGAAIKAFVANETHVMFTKKKEPIMMMPFWRVSITLNDEPENLMVLPPLDKSLVDKITILKAHPTKIHYDEGSEEARKEWRMKLSAELPAFLSFIASWRVPDDLRDIRYGIKAYQHPDVLDALSELSPQLRLLTLIDALVPWDTHGNAWEGTAATLEELLLTNDRVGRMDRLMTFNNACGAYLSRLAEEKPNRVQIAKRANGRCVWRIHPQPEEPIEE